MVRNEGTGLYLHIFQFPEDRLITAEEGQPSSLRGSDQVKLLKLRMKGENEV